MVDVDFDAERALERALAERDAQVAIIKQLEAELSEAKQIAMDFCAAYIELAQALGFNWIDIQSGEIKHVDVVKAAGERL